MISTIQIHAKEVINAHNADPPAIDCDESIQNKTRILRFH
jgi:hypothetical protein